MTSKEIEEAIDTFKNYISAITMGDGKSVTSVKLFKNAISTALEALKQISEIKKIIAMDNMDIQEDAVKYKMICEILKDKGR